MSRLDSFIRRVSAQRDCLNATAALVSALEGHILEVGLGNGRTYDHLRELFPDREIYVFDRRIAAHPACIPPPENCFLGELEDTFPQARKRLGATVAFAHVDIGSGKPEVDERVAAFLSAQIPGIMVPGGLIVADQALQAKQLQTEPLPARVPADRYFIYRMLPSADT